MHLDAVPQPAPAGQGFEARQVEARVVAQHQAVGRPALQRGEVELKGAPVVCEPQARPPRARLRVSAAGTVAVSSRMLRCGAAAVAGTGVCAITSSCVDDPSISRWPRPARSVAHAHRRGPRAAVLPVLELHPPRWHTPPNARTARHHRSLPSARRSGGRRATLRRVQLLDLFVLVHRGAADHYSRGLRVASASSAWCEARRHALDDETIVPRCPFDDRRRLHWLAPSEVGPRR